MEYLPLFLLFAAALIAAWFYLQRAKTRDVTTEPHPSATPAAADPDGDEAR